MLTDVLTKMSHLANVAVDVLQETIEVLQAAVLSKRANLPNSEGRSEQKENSAMHCREDRSRPTQNEKEKSKQIRAKQKEYSQTGLRRARLKRA